MRGRRIIERANRRITRQWWATSAWPLIPFEGPNASPSIAHRSARISARFHGSALFYAGFWLIGGPFFDSGAVCHGLGGGPPPFPRRKINGTHTRAENVLFIRPFFFFGRNSYNSITSSDTCRGKVKINIRKRVMFQFHGGKYESIALLQHWLPRINQWREYTD